MSNAGYTVQSRRRGGNNREPVFDRDQASFLRDVPTYDGTREDYTRAHAHHYGQEERLPPDGSHPQGKLRFPPGSDRQRKHEQYTASTKPRDAARKQYDAGVREADAEFRRMTMEEKMYYKKNTGGYPPHQHEVLDPFARELRDKSYNNARNREDFLRSHPVGYHRLDDHEQHHQWAEGAYGEYERARDNQKHHEKYRSYASIDSREDKWGRPVSHNRH